MVKVKSRIPLEYLKTKIQPLSKSDKDESEINKDVPKPGPSGNGTTISETKIQDNTYNRKCEDVVDSSGSQLPKPKEVDIIVPDSSVSEVVHNSRAVFSNWIAAGKGLPDGVMKTKRARYCNLDLNYIVSQGIPSKFEIIKVGEDETASTKTNQNTKGSETETIITTKRNPSQNIQGQGGEIKTAINTNQSIQEDTNTLRSNISASSPCFVSKRSEIQKLANLATDHMNIQVVSQSTPQKPSLPPKKLNLFEKLSPADKGHVYGGTKIGVVNTSPKPKEDDITGSIFELEQDEISTPKGAKKGKLSLPTLKFPNNPAWIDPAALLEELWDKKQGLRLVSDPAEKFKLPAENLVLKGPSWEIPGLIDFKNKLNTVKSTLDYFPLNDWHQHTKKMNVAQLVMSYVKSYFNAEFSSQAWGKMFEILCAFDVIPPRVVEGAEDIIRSGGNDNIPFDSIHLCEAPGAFISALNHFIKISYPPIDWNWLATTLNPYHENNNCGNMINDDRLILMSLNRWTFLKDNTGNILSKDNLLQLAEDANNKLTNPRYPTEPEPATGQRPSHVLLVTADGSIDCQSYPSDQEMLVAHLHFAEIVSALMVLEKTGTFVIKMFTFLEAPTICHLYLLSCVFREVTLFKPATSREGNSEVYVVCLDYMGRDCLGGLLDKLLDNVEDYEKHVKNGVPLFPLSAIPKFFMDRIEDASAYFCNYQMKIIKRNASCFPCDTRVYLAMKPYRKEVAEQWIEWSAIHPLAKEHRLFVHDADETAASHKFMPKFMNNTASHVDIRTERGCFADKLVRLNGNMLQKFELMRQDLSSYEIWKGPQNMTLFGGVYRMQSVIFEKAYTNIRCSRFCNGRLLSTRDECREIILPYKTVLEMNGLGDMHACSTCAGHDSPRVYETMSKHCDLGLQQLDCICFLKTTWNLVGTTDFEDQKSDLNNLFAEVKALDRERSLFLCRFPLITRLQTGIIYCLSGVFEKVIIYSDQKKNVTGVLLHNYKGFLHPDQKRLDTSMQDVLDVLNNFDSPVLEFAPMKILLEFFPADFLIQYNTLVITQDMLRTINVVERILKFIEKKFPLKGNTTM